mmetsp:Transcript_8582/g.12681  ORF Transcript_8582/g.12681 Transcript_8582/m.12681 type:complete len:211 (+) Transcript_8582:203-835(+)
MLQRIITYTILHLKAHDDLVNCQTSRIITYYIFLHIVACNFIVIHQIEKQAQNLHRLLHITHVTTITTTLTILCKRTTIDGPAQSILFIYYLSFQYRFDTSNERMRTNVRLIGCNKLSNRSSYSSDCLPTCHRQFRKLIHFLQCILLLLWLLLLFLFSHCTGTRFRQEIAQHTLPFQHLNFVRSAPLSITDANVLHHPSAIAIASVTARH